ncbi:MAG: heme ABC exporter ATP-binding protein CcmA [Fidelibacterota bacterium]|nr:MAG: heme ABC exporter ATP-binding protein CcmA [Candidatus Neomarinimicrobiota bacterium]
MTTLFTAQHISKSFHLRPVLSDVSFSLESGEVVLLFGLNGCGKTTLLRILAGIMRPETGDASLNGQTLFTLDSRWRRDMVYLGHRPIMYPAFTAKENMQLSIRLRGQAWAEDKFQDQLRHYNLAGRENEPIRVYSEGMLQRLGLIRLELASWRVALLDEPSSALDVDGADLLQGTIKRWSTENRTVLFTSHDMGWGAEMADRALLLSKGIIREELTSPKESSLLSCLGSEQ